MKEFTLTNPILPIERAEAFITGGLYFGYPQCCIQQFIDRFPNCSTGLEAEVHQHFGFIPCDKHAQDIREGISTLDSLIDERQCETPFPRDGY